MGCFLDLITSTKDIIAFSALSYSPLRFLKPVKAIIIFPLGIMTSARVSTDDRSVCLEAVGFLADATVFGCFAGVDLKYEKLPLLEPSSTLSSSLSLKLEDTEESSLRADLLLSFFEEDGVTE